MPPLKALLFAIVASLGFLVLPAQTDDGANKQQRAQGYYTLKKILDQESNLSKVLIIKDPKTGIENFMKRVSEVSGKYNNELDQWFKQDPSLVAKSDGFPPIERKARNGIESATTKSMLLTGDKNFEVRVLVSQIQATDYLRNTFEALEETETSEKRKGRLKAGKEDYEKLMGEAYQLLGAKK